VIDISLAKMAPLVASHREDDSAGHSHDAEDEVNEIHYDFSFFEYRLRMARPIQPANGSDAIVAVFPARDRRTAFPGPGAGVSSTGSVLSWLI
jgi:hypothetical protein